MTKEYQTGKSYKYTATIRIDVFQRVLEEYSHAVECYHTKMTPYRYEPQHAQQDHRIEEYKEEHSTPGIPVDAEELADDVKDMRKRGTTNSLKAKLVLETEGQDTQTVRLDTALKTYKIHVDTNEVKFNND